ncbi:FISUMP domain-containing protein [Aquiflexum sp.]|uniref:FISUMP domain-containing protein n=1 Tax=Aquiflexum sp. TaxID=1872584 RepID=UPI0035941C75
MKNQFTNRKVMQVLQSWKSHIWLTFGLLLLVGACNEGMFNDDDLKNDLELQAQFLLSKVDKIGISDAAHGGIDEFYFLEQTIGKAPKFNGTFHSNLNPIVEISDDFEFKTFHQVFSRDAFGVKQLMVNQTDEFYLANWNTAETKAVKGKIYRIRVRVGERVMGFVDVGIVSPQTKKLENNLVPLVENQTMKIAFRLEDKICPARIEVLPEEATVPVDGEQQFEAIVYNFYDEVLEDQNVKWMLGDNEIASISSTGLSKGLQAGEVTVFAQSQDVTGTATLTVEEEEDPNTVTDIEGNVYKTVQIGDRTWMAENLKVTKYNDGTPLRFLTFGVDGNVEGYFSYNNNLQNGERDGFIYTKWVTATLSEKNICPEGWHVPTHNEWITHLFAVLAPGLPSDWPTIAANKMVLGSSWPDMTIDENTNISRFNALRTGTLSLGISQGFGNNSTTWLTLEGPGNPPNVIFGINPTFLENGVSIAGDTGAFNFPGCIRCLKD